VIVFWCADVGVVPDAGGHGQEALTDAGVETVSAARSVLFDGNAYGVNSKTSTPPVPARTSPNSNSGESSPEPPGWLT